MYIVYGDVTNSLSLLYLCLFCNNEKLHHLIWMIFKRSYRGRVKCLCYLNDYIQFIEQVSQFTDYKDHDI